MVYIGQQLRVLKEELHVSEEELAFTLCITQGTLNKYINNKLKAPFDFVINIPKKIKTNSAMDVVLEWRKKFDEMFWHELITA